MANLQFGGVNGNINGRAVMSGTVSARQAINGAINLGVIAQKQVVSKTTAEWNAQPMLISAKDVIYVYTDYKIVDDQPVPNLKVGDGNAYLIDLPFIAADGVTEEQIAFWNNKVSVRLDELDAENMILYTD